MKIPNNLKKIIEQAVFIVNNETNDWLRIKKLLFHRFPNSGRKRFSKRHVNTKKQILNNFDIAIMNYWKEITGTELVVDPLKIHPKDYVCGKRGWALLVYHEKRRKEKLEKASKANE